MLVFARSYVAAYDGRIQKYFQVMERLGLPYVFVGWRRDDGAYQPHPKEILYERPSTLGAGWRNAWSILGWNVFVFAFLIKHRREIAAVHAVDLDTAVAAHIFCRVFRKPLIFDIYDKYSAVRDVAGIAGRLMDAIERQIARRAELTLLAGEDRMEQMQLPAQLSNCLVLENIPLAVVPASPLPKFDGRWRIGYFGVLEPRHRGLEDLLSVAADRTDVELHLAGYGGLEEAVAQQASAHANIHFHGPMDSSAGLSLMAQMHVIAGLYYLSVPNHAYAAPNKYFEHLLLGRGMLTTENTAPGHKVEAHSTGWAIAEGEEALRTWLSVLTREGVEQAGSAARAVWNTRYQGYFDDVYVGEYGRRISSLVKNTHHV